jgi:hypothetical protein
MQLPLQNFRKNVHKSLIHMETASPKMRNRHFGVELRSSAQRMSATCSPKLSAWSMSAARKP